MYADSDLIEISGLQHLTFCERQWMLIHVEQLWAENVLTVEGKHLHKNVHRAAGESRGEVRLAAGLWLRSLKLGICGIADMVEFRRDDENGVVVPRFRDKTKKWLPYPVEYKRGYPRRDHADEIQMCAQALCLEEMLGCRIPEGAVYHGEPRRRTPVPLTQELRSEVAAKCSRARELLSGSSRPIFETGRRCRSCSMNEYCMPEETCSADRSQRYVQSLFKLGE